MNVAAVIAARRRLLIGGGSPDPVVWNSADKGANIILSTTTNTNDTAKGSGATWHSVRADKSISIGKAYWEIKILAFATQSYLFGAADNNASMTTFIGGSASGAAARGNTAGTWLNTWTQANALSQVGEAVNDVLHCAYDAATDDFWIGMNGTWWVGDPAAGTSPWVGNASGTVFPAVGFTNGNVSLQLRSKSSEFTLTVPSGFSALADVAA